MRTFFKKLLAWAGIISIVLINIFLYAGLFTDGPVQIALAIICGIGILAMVGFHLNRNKAIDIKKIMGGNDKDIERDNDA